MVGVFRRSKKQTQNDGYCWEAFVILFVFNLHLFSAFAAEQITVEALLIILKNERPFETLNNVCLDVINMNSGFVVYPAN